MQYVTRRLLCAALLLGAGCARFAPASTEYPPIELPATGVDPTPFVEPLERRLAGLTTFRASGTVQFERQGDPVRQTDFLLLAGPGAKVRMRGTRAIGPVLFELIADERDFTFTIPVRRQAFTGTRGPSEQEAEVLVPGTVTDPLRVRLHPQSIRYVVHSAAGTNLVELVRTAPDGPWRIAQRVAFDPQTGRVSQVTAFNGEGAAEMITSFDDYRQLPDTGPHDTFPFYVLIQRPIAQVTVTMHFTEVIPNVEIPETAFDPTPPAGFTIAPAAEFDPNDLDDDAAAAS